MILHIFAPIYRACITMSRLRGSQKLSRHPRPLRSSWLDGMEVEGFLFSPSPIARVAQHAARCWHGNMVAK